MIVGENIRNHIGALVIYVLIITSKLIVIEEDAKKPNVSIARNILVNPTSVPELAEMGYIDVKVADFGLAKAKLMSLTTTN